jgi:hypothetical protein
VLRPRCHGPDPPLHAHQLQSITAQQTASEGRRPATRPRRIEGLKTATVVTQPVPDNAGFYPLTTTTRVRKCRSYLRSGKEHFASEALNVQRSSVLEVPPPAQPTQHGQCQSNHPNWNTRALFKRNAHRIPHAATCIGGPDLALVAWSWCSRWRMRSCCWRAVAWCAARACFTSPSSAATCARYRPSVPEAASPAAAMAACSTTRGEASQGHSRAGLASNPILRTFSTSVQPPRHEADPQTLEKTGQKQAAKSAQAPNSSHLPAAGPRVVARVSSARGVAVSRLRLGLGQGGSHGPDGIRTAPREKLHGREQIRPEPRPGTRP